MTSFDFSSLLSQTSTMISSINKRRPGYWQPSKIVQDEKTINKRGLQAIAHAESFKIAGCDLRPQLRLMTMRLPFAYRAKLHKGLTCNTYLAHSVGSGDSMVSTRHWQLSFNFIDPPDDGPTCLPTRTFRFNSFSKFFYLSTHSQKLFSVSLAKICYQQRIA